MIWFFFFSSRELSPSNKTACYGVAVLRGVILLETCTSTIDIFCKLHAGGGGFGQGPKGKVFFLGEGHSFLKGGEWIIQIFPAHFFNRPPLACLHLNIWTQPSMLVLPHFLGRDLVSHLFEEIYSELVRILHLWHLCSRDLLLLSPTDKPYHRSRYCICL